MESKAIEPIFKGHTGVLIATGPSLNKEQVEVVRKAHAAGDCKVITVNNAYQLAPWTDAHISCNDDWWKHYWNDDHLLRQIAAEKYTWYPELAKAYGIRYIKAIVKDGLSLDPTVIHINHGSGPMGLNLALHYGFDRLLLIGHDMKFAKDYNGLQRKVGSEPRHFFGEYPKELQHWPSVKIGRSAPGVIDGLIEAYNKMPPDLQKAGMEVINCTPDSALPTFRLSTLEKEL